jgi:L-lactate dehydrogenase
VTNILESILYDEQRILPVSGLLRGFRGMEDVCLSVPRIVGCAGLEPPLPIPMTVDEECGLHASADRIRNVVRDLGY